MAEKVLLKDGTYSGEAMGNNGTIAVEVTVEEGQISDIVFSKFVDDKECFDEDKEGKEMINRVLEKGSTDVDGISGDCTGQENRRRDPHLGWLMRD